MALLLFRPFLLLLTLLLLRCLLWWRRGDDEEESLALPDDGDEGEVDAEEDGCDPEDDELLLFLRGDRGFFLFCFRSAGDGGPESPDEEVAL